MDVNDVPTALQDRLGPEATAGLIELLTEAREEWTAEMIERVGDRFERRLTDETTRVRIEMVQGFASVRQDLTEGLSQVRQELTEGLSQVRQELAEGLSQVRQELAEGLGQVRQELAEGLSQVRQEMAEGLSQVRQEMMAGFAALRQEIADTRFELLKWTFVFWVGQLFALAGFLAVLIRFLRPAA
jgi:DNA anti-recombination protein RmuC